MQPHQTLQLSPFSPQAQVPALPPRRRRRKPATSQIPLPLPHDGWNENALRLAHRTARVPMSFEVAMQSPAMAICLKCLTEARHRQSTAALAH